MDQEKFTNKEGTLMFQRTDKNFWRVFMTTKHVLFSKIFNTPGLSYLHSSSNYLDDRLIKGGRVRSLDNLCPNSFITLGVCVLDNAVLKDSFVISFSALEGDSARISEVSSGSRIVDSEICTKNALLIDNSKIYKSKLNMHIGLIQNSSILDGVKIDTADSERNLRIIYSKVQSNSELIYDSNGGSCACIEIRDSNIEGGTKIKNNPHEITNCYMSGYKTKEGKDYVSYLADKSLIDCC